jgi:chorismate mutase
VSDPVVERIREQITEIDRSVVEAINERLRLVRELRRYKQSKGIPFLDPSREEWMLGYLIRGNSGPLSEAGLAEFYAQLLDLTKRETAGEA